MTLLCEELFQDSALPSHILIALYRGFIEKWHKKMNQLSFAKLSVRIAEMLGKGFAFLFVGFLILFL